MHNVDIQKQNVDIQKQNIYIQKAQWLIFKSTRLIFKSKTCKESDLLEHGEKVFQAAAEAVELAKDVPVDILEMVITLYSI